MQEDAVTCRTRLPVKQGFVLEIKRLGGYSYSASTGGETSGEEPQGRTVCGVRVDRETDKEKNTLYVPYILAKLLSL